MYKIYITIAVILGSILFATFGVASGFFHDKPEKPTIITQNPTIIEEFDKLYAKYPHITQQDVNEAHQAAATKCYTETYNSMEDRESRDNPFGQLVGLSFCQGFMSGEMEDFLDQLGIQYYSNEGSTPPTLIN